MAAGGEALVSGWLDSTLTDSLAFADDETNEEQAYKIAAARGALRQLAPEGASLAERMQAVQYVCAFQAGQLALAEANSPYLPPEERRAARRFSRQAMALSSRQLALLDRLGRERRGEQEDSRHRTAVAEAQRQRREIPRGNGFDGEMERMPEDREKSADGAAAAGLAGPPAPTAQGETAPGPATAVDESRQQRRARERRERKAQRRLKGAA